MNRNSCNTLEGHSSTTVSNPEVRQLVDAATCLAIIFPNKSFQPSIRTFWKWKAKQWIPYVKIGRMVLFDPQEVRRVIDKRFTVHSIMD